MAIDLTSVLMNDSACDVSCEMRRRSGAYFVNPVRPITARPVFLARAVWSQGLSVFHRADQRRLIGAGPVQACTCTAALR
jgi:hypothetical protein